MSYLFKDKAVNVRQLNDYMIAKTLSMFEYDNLPETIPKRELEYLLQINGYAFITKVGDDLYAFSGGLGGLPDAYGRPTEIVITNPSLNFNKTLSLKDDGVLIFNDSMGLGLLPIYEKHNTLLIENDINMVLHGYNTRINTLISAGDDKTRQSAETYLNKIIDGEVGVIAENALFDGVRVQGVTTGQGNAITAMTEYHQYIKASLYNEIGLSLNFNMKRERLTSGEVDQSDGSLFPFVYNMMENRLTGMSEINAMYETDITIGFGSVWHQKDKELVDDIVDDVSHETIDPVNEPLDEPLDEPLENPDETVVQDTDPLEVEQAKTIDELMEMLKDDDLTDDDINAINELIKEIKDDD